MKKTVCVLMMVVMLLSITVHAKNGDKVGVALNTDIVVYINNYAVPSYAVNGTSCIVAEDMRNFGFDVVWNNTARTLSIYRNSDIYVNGMSFSKDAKPGSVFANILETDIAVYANDIKITSYAMNGYTMIPVEELTMFGVVNWVGEERALKLWVDGLHIRETMQYVEQYKEPAPTYVPTYTPTTYQSQPAYNPTANGSYYRTPSGKRYHLDPNCGGKNSYKTTNISGLSPCNKCAQ